MYKLATYSYYSVWPVLPETERPMDITEIEEVYNTEEMLSAESGQVVYFATSIYACISDHRPDNYVQDATSTQAYNRYSYALNNPLKYRDPDGENPLIIGAAIIGGIVNVATHLHQIESPVDVLVVFGIDAVAGGIAAATFGVIAVPGAGVFLSNFTTGLVSSAYANPIRNIGNQLYFHDPYPSSKEQLKQIVFDGFTSGVSASAVDALSKAFAKTVATRVPAQYAEMTPGQGKMRLDDGSWMDATESQYYSSIDDGAAKTSTSVLEGVVKYN